MDKFVSQIHVQMLVGLTLSAAWFTILSDARAFMVTQEAVTTTNVKKSVCPFNFYVMSLNY